MPLLPTHGQPPMRETRLGLVALRTCHVVIPTGSAVTRAICATRHASTRRKLDAGRATILIRGAIDVSEAAARDIPGTAKAGRRLVRRRATGWRGERTGTTAGTGRTAAGIRSGTRPGRLVPARRATRLTRRAGAATERTATADRPSGEADGLWVIGSRGTLHRVGTPASSGCMRRLSPFALGGNIVERTRSEGRPPCATGDGTQQAAAGCPPCCGYASQRI